MTDCIVEGISERVSTLTLKKLWEEIYGPIPDGLYLLHKCDNPPCRNIDHIFLGTQKDNIQDCIEKGRFIYPPSGWNTGKSTPDEIKKKQSESQKGIPRGPMPEIHKKSISEGQLGNIRGPYSEEHKKAISEGIKKVSHKIAQNNRDRVIKRKKELEEMRANIRRLNAK